MKQLTSRPLQDSDIALFETWVMREHVARWYEQPLDWVEEMQRRKAEFDWITHLILLYGEREIGFGQVYPYWKSGEDWQGTLPVEGTYSMDYLIGEPEFIGVGLGRETVRLLSELIFQWPDAQRIIVQPDEENLSSRGALLSAGYAYDDRNGVFLLERTTAAFLN